MFNDTDVIELQAAITKFHQKMRKEAEGRKSTLDIIRELDRLGERLAAHFTLHGVKAYYSVAPGQIISIDICLNAEQNYDALPDYYRNEKAISEL